MTKEKAFCCFSGGKDSILSLYRAQKEGINVSYLVNMMSEDGRHSRSHGIRSKCLKKQAMSVGIPLLQEKTTWQDYESKFKKLISGLNEKGISTGIFGDIDLQAHRDWVERVCGEAGVKAVLPLWGGERWELLTEFMDSGFKAVICTVRSELLGEKYLGRIIDRSFIEEIEGMEDIDICGENGEYHSFVYDGPLFKEIIRYTLGDKILKENVYFQEINV
ncbi:diphthine--ammonia ligase [Elusimicrobiota bacterium]